MLRIRSTSLKLNLSLTFYSLSCVNMSKISWTLSSEGRFRNRTEITTVSPNLYSNKQFRVQEAPGSSEPDFIMSFSYSRLSRKEVFQPHLPVRLPCYDLAPITGFALGRSLRSRTSGTPGFHGLTGGVYKARERIHRAMADARLLANPASWGRVADPSPN